jgi:PAS domain S-box-containing protein
MAGARTRVSQRKDRGQEMLTRPFLHQSHRAKLRAVNAKLAPMALGLVALWWLPLPAMLQGMAGYESFHTFVETLAIVVAGLIFAVVWNAPHGKLSWNIVLLACAFAGVGLLDFSHLLSIQGMPSYVTPSDAEKGINFWLAARLLAATALLTVAVARWRSLESVSVRYGLLAGVLAFVALAHWLFLFHPGKMPRTFVAGQGLTDFKLGAEYLLMVLNLAAVLALLWRMRGPLAFNAAGLLGAAAAMAMSGFLFTLYADVSDIFNVAGHLYKVVSYLFLYQAVFVETIERPYREIHQLQSQLKATLDAVPDLIFELDLEGRYRQYHASPHDPLAAAPEYYLGRTVAEMLPPDAARVILGALHEAHEQGLSAGHQFALDLGAGQRWFELSVSRKAPLPGEPSSLIVLAHDVTERKRAEEEIRYKNTMLLTQQEASLDAILVVDENGKIISFNQQFIELWRLSPQLLSAGLDAPVLQSVAGQVENPQAFVARAHYLYEHRDDRSREEVRLKDGRVIDRYSAPVTGADGQHYGRVWYFRDITEGRQARDEILRLNAELEKRVEQRTAQLEFANQELEAFSYSVSHDLRTPLSSIDGYSSRLASEIGAGAAGERSQHYLARIRAGVVQMGELIDALLSLAQVSRSSLRWDRVDLSAMAGAVLNACREREPGRLAQTDIAPGLVAHGDARLLQQVLDNLLGNAWKFSGRQPQTRISFGRETGPDGQAVYAVRDNGAGFDMAYSEKLFGAFQRLHSVSEFAGTGIGLATVHRIITRHGGKVWAESAPGQGATFYFTLGQPQGALVQP